MKILFTDYALGAGVATDLVNTAPVVRGAGEALPDAVALERFLAEHELGVTATGADLGQVHALRQEVRAVLEARTEDQAVESATALVTRAGLGPVLHRDAADRWQWYVETSPDASLAGELAVLIGTGLLGVVRTLSHDRFRHCASPVCDGMFVDTSRAGRRRYCMPDLCGNRLNVANHRARRRAQS
ncbi:CGNR zinc finger domain-containing protein [Amycolatopsis nigrescens]|uniref:CGNR zinc finger domain-containing protein n=1 Tax=Amycolatopsis nigrescens TaxID=381445 RepID=UPI0003A41752|nr:CGNR zinc finger domain-containing protein [Amycolatopsis nigrescens]